jgi:hypothetical protein
MSCNRKNQWNINDTIGWKSPDPDDFVVLILREKVVQTDGQYGEEMKRLDSTLSRELTYRKLGEIVDARDEQYTELHYVVSKDFKPALEVIMETVSKFRIQVVVSKRKYHRDGSWTDELL